MISQWELQVGRFGSRLTWGGSVYLLEQGVVCMLFVAGKYQPRFGDVAT